jgi:choline dehydrogenase-like flavoprotein
MPPLPVKSSGVLFERGARKLGLHPFPAPMAIASVPFRGRPGCAHCGFCMGFGCEVMAKSSSLYTMIPEAEATGRCEVAESYVFNVAVNAAGRTTGVHYFDRTKHERFQKARAVVVSANGAGDGALAAQFREQPLPAWLGELQRHGGQAPHVQSGSGRAGGVRA